MGLPAVSLADNRLQDIKNAKYQLVFASAEEVLSKSFLQFVSDVNKTDRPNTTPMVRAICTFAVYFSVFWHFCRFTLVYEGHFI